MLVDFRDERRIFLGRVEIDPAERPAAVELHRGGAETTHRKLQWDNALDAAGLLQGCLSCGCRELFVRKAFPQVLGLSLVIGAAVLSLIFFSLGQVIWSVGILAVAVGVDSLIFFFTPKCIVCYRCRTEYLRSKISESLKPWDLSLGEKYRPVRLNAAAGTGENESAFANSN